MICLGMVALAHGRAPEAAAYGRRASNLIRQWASPWDKSLSATQWLALATFLIDCGALVEENLSSFSNRINAMLEASGYRPERWYGRLSSADLLRTPEGDQADTQDTAESRRRIAIQVGSKSRLERYIAGLSFHNNIDAMQWYPDLPSQPWYEASDFSLTRDLELQSSDIISEISMLDLSRYHRESESIGRTGNWDVMMLFERGKRNEENCSLLPKTSAIIESCRSLKSLSGLAYVSRLAPRTRVEPHRGPTNLRLRCHLGIRVPDACGIRVDHDSRRWSEGKCLVFDDSFEHEVWNDSERERIVLIVDIWHPDLSESEIGVIEGLHRYVHSQSLKLFNYWKMNETTRIRENSVCNRA
jgi:aspartate beta-hydroxylase